MLTLARSINHGELESTSSLLGIGENLRRLLERVELLKRCWTVGQS